MNQSVLFPFLFLALVTMAYTNARAEPELVTEPVIKTEAGTLSTRVWSGVSRVPTTMQLLDEASDRQGHRRVWKGGIASLQADPKTPARLTFINQGRNDRDKVGHAAMVVFAPSEPGTFALHGTLTLGGQKPELLPMWWAVVRIAKDGSLSLITIGRGKKGDVIELQKQVGYGHVSLGRVRLADGESLGFTAYWQPEQDGGGAHLDGFKVVRVADAQPVPATPLAKPAPSPNDRRYPSDGGFVDVTKEPYLAKGDGITDDTDAIQRAMQDNARSTVFLPNGTYLISRQLNWLSKSGSRFAGLQVLGESREGTILKLQDNCPLYGKTDLDAFTQPALAVIRTESDSGPPDAAIQNYIRNLTVDTGKGNAGAIGVNFIGNNIAAVENVTIRSGDGSGLIGLAMNRIPGPALVKNVSVEGFDYGITMREYLYNMVLDGIDIRNQRVAGIMNAAGMMTIHDLKSINQVPALVNRSSKHPNSTEEAPLPSIKYAMTQLIRARLSGGAADQPAIINASHLYLRDITAEGYRVALNHNGTDQPGSRVEEFVGDTVLKLWDDAPGQAASIDIAPTPAEFHSNDFADWTKPQDYAHLLHRPHEPVPGQDAAIVEYKPSETLDHTAAIQAALDSGKPIVYFPRGKYQVSRPLIVPPHVKRLALMRSTIRLIDGLSESFSDSAKPQPALRIVGETDVPLTIDFLIYAGGNGAARGAAYAIQHDSARPLSIRHSLISGYRNASGSGPLFVENNCSTQFYFDQPGAKAYFKQVNPEGQTLRIVNNGGQVSILGIKTEGGESVVQTLGGGRTEVIGAFLRPSAGYPMDAPAFEIIDSNMSIIACGMSWADQRSGPRRDRDYHYYIRETRAGETRTITWDDLKEKGLNARTSGVVPFFRAGTDTLAAPNVTIPDRTAARVPAPWKLVDIGRPDDAGEARFFAGGALLEFSGMNRNGGGRELRRVIGSEEDAGSFLYTSLPGDGDISTRIGSWTHTYGPYLKAGLMYRTSLDAGSPAVFLGAYVKPGPNKTHTQQIVMLERSKPNSPMQSVGAIDISGPTFIRLERRSGEMLGWTRTSESDDWKMIAKVAWKDTRPDGLAGAAIAGENGTHAATALFESLTVATANGRRIAGPDAAATAPWISTDTAPSTAGRSLLFPGSTKQLAENTFALTGSGWSYDSRDYTHYLFQVVPSNTQLVARVRWETPRDQLPAPSKAGLSIRDSAGHMGVRRLTLSITPDELYMENRAGDKSDAKREPRQGDGTWLKLAVKDRVLLAYKSADGKSWQLMGAQATKSFPMSACLGLHTTSGILQKQVTAVFDGVRLEPADVPQADLDAARE